MNSLDSEFVFQVDTEELGNIIQYISSFGIEKLESAPPTLEDLFMRHYEGTEDHQLASGVQNNGFLVFHGTGFLTKLILRQNRLKLLSMVNRINWNNRWNCLRLPWSISRSGINNGLCVNGK